MRESSKLLCNRVILFLLQFFHLSFDLCLPAGLNGTRHSTGMLYEKSNEIKDNNSGKGRDVMSASGSIRARSLTGIYYLMIGDVCRDNYFLENKKRYN